MKRKKCDDSNKVKRTVLIISIILMLLPGLPVFSAGSNPMILENDETRRMMRELITAPTSDVLSAGDRIISQLTDGARVSFKIKEQNDSFYLLFINEKNGRYPIYSRGTYIIKRSLESGKFLQIKIFLNNEDDCYARIYPNDDRAVLEIVLYGQRIYSDINLPFSFADALTGAFSDVIEATEGMVNWSLILPDPDELRYYDKVSLVADIRKMLPQMKDADDGAMDADGSWVYIETLEPQRENGFNCSGFVKWVADGIYWGSTGEYMNIEDLKQKNLNARGNRWSSPHEDDRDPYFGLDWTRNIAGTLQAAKRGEDSGYKDSDVRYAPWSDYVEDVGFSIENLKLVMYYLAVTNPSDIYLVSVNVPWGTKPILRQHVHTAVLFPVIDANVGFRDIIMERGSETDADDLAERYPGAHVHLVRVKMDSAYLLPELIEKQGVGIENFFRR
jgi:hypothetical protein